MLSFAGNGQNELLLKNFNTVTIENSLTAVEAQEFSVSSTASYEIVIWLTFCETFEDGSIGEINYGVPVSPVSCVDAATLASIKAMYESIYLYWLMYPNACKIEARETLIDDDCP